MIVLPMVELPCSSPTAKNESFCSSGALAQDHVDDEALVVQPLELGLEHQRPARAPRLEEERRVLLAVDQLALQPPALMRAQQLASSRRLRP